MSRKEKKKKTVNVDGGHVGLQKWQGHRNADGHIGVWTQMRCMWMQMSRKEKEKTYFVNVDSGQLACGSVDVLVCGRGCAVCGCG